jgi:threonylcarbamoyladenosine tRNA methylthiotransferase MtaB
MFRFSVLTFGCRVNQADSFACERELVDSGGQPGEADEADIVVVNTCSVTAAADQAARQAIRRVARRNPHARIIATGCYATRNPADLATLPGVVELLSNGDKGHLSAALGLAGREPSAESRKPSTFPRPGDRGRTAFPLCVQTGCNEACTYCTIPATRGPSRSRLVDRVLRDAAALAAAGYKELILTGVHLGAYGRDLRPSVSLVDLLHALAECPGDITFRISSLEPMDCPGEVVRVVAESRRFAPHFHLPLQHASDRVLEAMRRPYRLADYAALVDAVRERLPDAAIGCDVMAGFPGETDADHAQTVAYLDQSPITHLHVFPYSERPGTPASTMARKVPSSVARERAAALREIGRRQAGRFAAGQVGRVRPSVTIGDGSRAMTDNHLEVEIPAGLGRNRRADVRIVSAAPLRGEVIA